MVFSGFRRKHLLCQWAMEDFTWSPCIKLEGIKKIFGRTLFLIPPSWNWLDVVCQPLRGLGPVYLSWASWLVQVTCISQSKWRYCLQLAFLALPCYAFCLLSVNCFVFTLWQCILFYPGVTQLISYREFPKDTWCQDLLVLNLAMTDLVQTTGTKFYWKFTFVSHCM